MTSDNDARRLLSAARLAPYVAAGECLGCDPLGLYAWNVSVSAAFATGADARRTQGLHVRRARACLDSDSTVATPSIQNLILR